MNKFKELTQNQKEALIRSNIDYEKKDITVVELREIQTQMVMRAEENYDDDSWYNEMMMVVDNIDDYFNIID